MHVHLRTPDGKTRHTADISVRMQHHELVTARM